MATRSTADTYTKLVGQFRLVQIRDDKHLLEAHEMVERLMQEDLDASGLDYLNVLADLVEAYEERRYPIAHAPEGDVLRELMRANNLSQTALAKKVGITQSTISAVLNGTRALTKDHVIKLAEFFNVGPAAFLPRSKPGNWSPGDTGGAPHRMAAAPHS